VEACLFAGSSILVIVDRSDENDDIDSNMASWTIQ
jgi:hypothetical protein